MLTKAWNKPNQLKRLKKIAKQPETTSIFKIREIWNFLLVYVFQISSTNAQIWAFWAKKYQLSNLHEFLHLLYFEGTDFKFVICLWKFWAQRAIFWHFGPKSISFLILTKFCMHPFSNVLISNLALIFENF